MGSKIHSSQRYTVKSVYGNLTSAKVVRNDNFHHVLWLKAVPLKVNIFIRCLFLNRLATKDNLFRRHILGDGETFCSAECGFMEDRDHLFLCVIWSIVVTNC